MDADSARHLSETRDGLFHVAAVEHHEIGQLVDDDHDVGQRLFFRAIFKQTRSVVAFEELVVLVDIAHALFGEQL